MELNESELAQLATKMSLWRRLPPIERCEPLPTLEGLECVDIQGAGYAGSYDELELQLLRFENDYLIDAQFRGHRVGAGLYETGDELYGRVQQLYESAERQSLTCSRDEAVARARDLLTGF